MKGGEEGEGVYEGVRGIWGGECSMKNDSLPACLEFVHRGR